MKLHAEEIGQGITCIETHYLRPGLACCYLLQAGDTAALIDTGTTHTVPMILELLGQKGIPREAVRYVIPTHVHLDHAGGSGALMEALPEATLIVHPQGARHLIDPSKLAAGAAAVYGEEAFAKNFGRLIPVPASRVVEAPEDHDLPLLAACILALRRAGTGRNRGRGRLRASLHADADGRPGRDITLETFESFAREVGP